MKRFPAFATFLAAVSPPVWAQLPPTPEKSAADVPRPRLFVETRTRDLGKILEGDIVDVSWKIENRGTADLLIDRTAAACGCTVVKLREEEKVVRPGSALNLQVEFNSTSRLGEQNKEIIFFSNDPAEPELKLSFLALVEQLVRTDPASSVNLRVLRRGETSSKPLEITPTPGRGDLEILQLNVEGGIHLAAKAEPFEEKGVKGTRVFFTVLDSAPLGPISSSVKLTFRVGQIERQKSFAVRGEVVAELTWLPKVIDTTRQPSLPGKMLAPLTVSSVEQRPFRILEAAGGAPLQVSVGPGKGRPGTEYSVQVGVSQDCAPGPFGTILRIHTDSLDQPVIEVPVFGIVAAPVEVDPPAVLLRQDGTEAGTRRRLRLKTADASALKIESIACDSPAVTVGVDQQASANYSHLAYVEARLTGSLPSGTHQAIIRISTQVPGGENIEVPVRIEVP